MRKKPGFILLGGLVLSLAIARSAPGRGESLDDAVQAVQAMIAQGRPRAEIAAWVTRTVDERLVSLNRKTSDERGGMHDSAYEVSKEAFDAWSREGVGVDEPYASAHWTWVNKVGHCQENAHLAYHILMMAGGSGEDLGELVCGDHVYVAWGIPKGFSGEITIAAINFWKGAWIIDPWQGVCKPAPEVGRLDFEMTKAGFKAINRVATWSYASYLKKYQLWLTDCADLGGRYGLENDTLVVTGVSGSSNIAIGQKQFMKPAGCFQVVVSGPCRVRVTFRNSVLEGNANGRLAALNQVIEGNTRSASVSLVKISGRECLKVTLRSEAGGVAVIREGILRKI
ncbi:MAG TPA: hypothetical protein PK919_07135 [Candidatus Aminicenantes bacterium]|nr:hypothetical protein [Candidatus Aminicenantes bacterium]